MDQPIPKLALAIALFFGATVNASSTASGSSLNNEASPPLLTAGIFRLESERSYKLSLQVTLGILDDQSRKERDRSLVAISRMRKELGNLTDKSVKTARALTRVNAALDDQVGALPKLTSANAGSMYDINEDLLNKLNFLSFALESETSDTGSRIVGLALRQASLAQRMAKIVLLRSVDRSLVNKQGLKVDLTQSKIEFANGLALLEGEAGTNRLLKDRINLAKQQWMFYETALGSAGGDSADLRNISTTSDRIAEQMVEIVRMGYALPPDPAIFARQ